VRAIEFDQQRTNLSNHKYLLSTKRKSMDTKLWHLLRYVRIPSYERIQPEAPMIVIIYRPGHLITIKSEILWEIRARLEITAWHRRITFDFIDWTKVLKFKQFWRCQFPINNLKPGPSLIQRLQSCMNRMADLQSMQTISQISIYSFRWIHVSLKLVFDSEKRPQSA
jgi:hypothetical protein